MKLKDYKDKIKGWPEKIMLPKGHFECFPNSSDFDKEKGFNQAHELFSNLEFNPAELVELDVKKLAKIIRGYIATEGDIHSSFSPHIIKLSEQIVKAKLEVLK